MKGASFAVIVAPDEIAAGQVIVRSMKEGKESKHPAGNLAQDLYKMLRAESLQRSSS
jgi:histidyl-tRNA synthetase